MLSISVSLNTHCFAFLSSVLTTWFQYSKMASNLESSGSQPVPRVRIATPADKDAYVTALITGYETDRQYTWRYPRRKEFPQDRRAASEQIFENLIADDKMVIYVAELPRIEDEGSENPDWIVVGEAVWEQKYWHQVDSEMGN